MPLILEDMQKAKVTVRGISKAGNPTGFFGPLAWGSSDTNVAAIAGQADPVAYVESVGPIGTARVTVSAFGDAAMTKPITGLIDVAIVAGPPDTLLIEASAPEPR